MNRYAIITLTTHICCGCLKSITITTAARLFGDLRHWPWPGTGAADVRDKPEGTRAF